MPRDDTLNQCDECRAIIEEFSRMLAEVRASPKLRDELRAAYEAMSGMRGGTEEDVERAEGVLGKFQIGPQRPGLLRTDVFSRMYEHGARTGHAPLFRK
jgi:hypothetical protein